MEWPLCGTGREGNVWIIDMTSPGQYGSAEFLRQFDGVRLDQPMHKCDVCGDNNWKYNSCHTRKLGIENTKFSVFSCHRCDFLRLLPLPTNDELACIYGRYAEEGDRFAVEHERARDIYPAKLDKLKKMTRDHRLLDVGAGLGTFVYAAKQKGFDAIGVEYTREQCERARETYGVELVNDVIENWQNHFELQTFDIVNLHHVFEHLLHPREILKTLKELLVPMGVLLIEVPNQFCDLRKEFFRRNDFKKLKGNPLHHQSFFSPRTLVKLVESDGFQLVECRQFRSGSVVTGGVIRTTAVWMYRKFVERYRLGGGSFIEGYFRRL